MSNEVLKKIMESYQDEIVLASILLASNLNTVIQKRKNEVPFLSPRGNFILVTFFGQFTLDY